MKFPHLSNLEDLGLHENNIGNEGAEALAAAAIHLKSLKYLNLSRNNIGNEGAKALAAAAIHLKSLKYLNLSQNNIGNEGVEALRMTNLIIDISSNPGDNRNEDFSRIKFPKRWIELNKDWM